MPDYALFDVTLTAITPLHIGNGNELLNEHDYAIHNNQTWRINEMALLDAVQGVDDLALAEQLARSKPQELLKPEQYSPNSSLFRYVLDGAPRSKEPGAQLNEQLKDVFDHPYIPGTTLKGAIRTALAWHLW
ncbi:MAG: type III-A CRISPR-associated RAMP protein Csm5, partial [Caldilineaceae bacterium]|nr:type III-A CRISPR-associated RAMP protein Csm5 [Caldilineaceae bacterium]